jgi:hypothetical protein
MLNRLWMPSPNYSSRGGSGVRLIVIHTAEGALTIESLAAWFANPSAGVSSHTGIDDTPGTVGEYVVAAQKSWCAANANPYAIQTELCGFAAWTAGDWDAHPVMLENCAQWIAEESARFGIPVRRLSEAQAAAGERGVCDHAALGYAGNDHWDVGSSFPWSRVLERAGGGGSGPAPPDDEAEDNMVLLDERSGGYWVAFKDGAVHAYDGAPFLGGANNDRYNPGRKPCLGIAGRLEADGGYCLVLDFGDRDCRRYEFPYDGSARV